MSAPLRDLVATVECSEHDQLRPLVESSASSQHHALVLCWIAQAVHCC